MKTIFTTVLVIAIVFSLVTGCKKSTSAEEGSNQETEVTGFAAMVKAFGGITPTESIQMTNVSFETLDGKPDNLANYSGDVIFLNIWATWCPSCVEEMPSMQRLHEQLKDDGLAMLAVSSGEPASKVTAYRDKNSLDLPIFTDSTGAVSRQYGTQYVPTTFLFDRKGVVAAVFIGSREWDSPEAISLIRELL
jgi:peroxiredoxin